MGLTMPEWDALDEYARSWILGTYYAEDKRKAEACPECGGPKSDCQNPDNQHAYVVTQRRCYRTRAIEEAKKARAKQAPDDFAGVLFVATLDPTRKKSATKKG